jgi:tRNA(fMet)-specific endonuclease VapC
MYVLDTDLLTLLENPLGVAARRLRARLDAVIEEPVVTTVISYEEQTRGWFAFLAKARTVGGEVDAYYRLLRHLENYRSMDVIAFDDRAAVEYQRLRSLRIRLGTMDLKIGAVCLANRATVLTRNVTDFRKVPGLTVEDWTV